MISIDEARALVDRYAVPRAPQRVPLAAAGNLVLAEDVTSQVDSPPHDKSLVDGFAVVAEDLGDGFAELVLLEEVAAGQTPAHRVQRGTATRIMTGAPIPQGADAVVMLERTEEISIGHGPPRIRIREPSVKPGQNIMVRGTSIRCGDKVLSAGRTIRPIEVGLLAELGRATVSAYLRPKVDVLATGSELVPVEAMPARSQIRNSNGPMLHALVQAAGGEALDLGIACDTEDELARRMRPGLASDVLLMSGGVSAGRFDLVPHVLERLGVQRIFHKVTLKPGKPLWFGVFAAEQANCLVFGLPGNPVSAFVCFQLFVRPGLARLGGRSAEEPSARSARLYGDCHPRSDRPTYFPARRHDHDGDAWVEALAWKGSSDLFTLTDANCLIFFPEGDRPYAAGERVSIVTF